MTAIERPHRIAAQQQNLGSGSTIAIEVRFTASLGAGSATPRYSERIEIPSETTIGDLIARYRLPLGGIARILCNGRDMNPGLYTGGNVDLGASISDGDVITFSGPSLEVWGTGTAAV